MITSGFIITLGFVFIFLKLSLELQLKILGRPVLTDVIVSVAAYLIHWGTFSGVMAAAVAGMLVSIFTKFGRAYWGYIDHLGFHPGWSNRNQ